MKRVLPQIASALLFVASSSASLAATFTPDAILPSDLTVQLESVGAFPNFAPIPQAINYASPQTVDGALIGVDQTGGVFRANPDGTTTTLFNAGTDSFDGMVLQDREAVLNVSQGSEQGKIFVTFTSDTRPDFSDSGSAASGYTVRELPPPLKGEVPSIPFDPTSLVEIADLYRPTPDDLSGFPDFIPKTTGVKYQVVYEFDIDGDDLINPRALTAFEVQSSPTGHHGGGMATTPDGKILFATGDNLPFGTNGRDAPQDDTEHVSKLFLIDPATGNAQVVAKGLRNVQQVQIFEKDGVQYVGFADIGGVTAEEVNVVLLDDILDTGTIENFGWGNAPDGAGGVTGREGTFYVSDGIPGILGTQPPATGWRPLPRQDSSSPTRNMDGSIRLLLSSR